MAWQNEGSDAKYSVTDRLRWAHQNYSKYGPEEKIHRRLSLMLNFLTIDALIASEGGEALLSPETVDAWLELYEAYRPRRPVGRPSKSSS